jgi:hypothetical protein
MQYIKGDNQSLHEAHMKGISEVLRIRDESLHHPPEDPAECALIERGLFW